MEEVRPLLMAQFIGSAIVTVSTFAVALGVMYAVNAMKLLRVSPEGEAHGLDLHEHGISAYPEYMITSSGRPSRAIVPADASRAASPARVGLTAEPHPRPS
jgi:ammonium transporter, Amt family